MQPAFLGPSYNLLSRPASVQRTVNLIPVPVEPGNDRTAWVFADVPGLLPFNVPVDPAPEPVGSFIGQSSATGGGIGTLFVVAHEPGDLLVLFAKRSMIGASDPTAHAGWTQPTGGLWGAGSPSPQRYRFEYLVDTAGDLATIGINANDAAVCLVYRGMVSVGAIQSAPFVGSTAYSPALATTNPAGSWFLQIGTSSLYDVALSGSGITSRYDQDASLGGGYVVITDTDGFEPVSPVANLNATASTFGSVAAVELLPGP